MAFCRFTGTRGGSTSEISVDLGSLVTTRPTLAALAYLEKPAAGRVPGSVNPASISCSRLGGSDQLGGETAGGGGWIVGRAAAPRTVFRYRPARLPTAFGG